MEYNITSTCANCAPHTSPSSSWCKDPTTSASIALISVLVILFLVVGSIGNFLTMLVIKKNNILHTPSNCFLFSLCISDLISGVICSPLWLYRRTWGFCRWELLEGMCAFYWAADFATNYATALHILSFSLLRCYAVHWPFDMSSITIKKTVIFICVLWAIAIVSAMPLFWLMGTVENRGLQSFGTHWPSCSICNTKNIANGCISQYNAYILIVSVLFFYVPEVCVIALSCCIVKVLVRRRRWRKSTSANNVVCETIPERSQLSIEHIQDADPKRQAKNKASNQDYNNSNFINQPPNHIKRSDSLLGQKNDARDMAARQVQIERNIFTQLSLIVFAFMIGYIPSSIYLVWTTATSSSDTGVDGDVDYWFGVVSYLCLRLSECMNPVMYNLGSGKIRKATKELFGISK